MRIAKLASVILSVVVLTSCGGGGSSTASPPSSPGGVWLGTTASGLPRVGLVTEAGDFFFYSFDGTTVFGKLSAIDSIIEGELSGILGAGLYFPNGSTSGTGTLAGTLNSRNSMAVTIDLTDALGGRSTTTERLTFDDLYNAPSSLAATAGNYLDPHTASVVSVDSSGGITSLDVSTGCRIGGRVSPVDPRFNAYNLSVNLSDCAGQYSSLNGQSARGLGTIDSTVVPNIAYFGFTSADKNYASFRALSRLGSLQLTDTWVEASPLPMAVRSHSATLLLTGKVLVVGGTLSDGTASSRVRTFDEASSTWSGAAPIPAGRSSHTATLLYGGRVLVVGGYDATGVAQRHAVIYDPATDSWTSAGQTVTARVGHSATLLTDGRVLVAGGVGCGLACASVEVFDPRTASWSPAAPLSTARTTHSAVRLQDGRVLAVGGGDGSGNALTSAEIYDPLSNAWSPTGSLAVPRASAGIALLPSGKVLMAGSAGYAAVPASASTEVFDPTLGTWTLTGSMSRGRGYLTLTPLATGKILAAGGVDGTAVANTDLFDPDAESWKVGSNMMLPRYAHTATLLPSGGALLVAGEDVAGQSTDHCEIYR